MKVSIYGSGYVGLVTGACLAEVGNDVLCVDVDERPTTRKLKGLIGLPMYWGAILQGVVLVVVPQYRSHAVYARASYDRRLENHFAIGVLNSPRNASTRNSAASGWVRICHQSPSNIFSEF